MAQDQKNTAEVSPKEQKRLLKQAEKEQAKASKEQAKAKKAKKKEKKTNTLVKKVKETGSELKKVTWPSFSTVVKNTGIVLGFVVISLVVLFGIETLLGLLYDVFTGAL